MTSLIDDDFKTAISEMLRPYFRGYYSASATSALEASKSYEGVPGREWEYLMVSTWHQFMLDWDVEAASKQLLNAAQRFEKMSSPEEAYKNFYTHLFVACICSTEHTNLNAVHRAANSATKCSVIFDSKFGGQKFAELVYLKNYDYFLPAWSAYWYRAQTRDILSLSRDALEDYTRAFKELTEDMNHYLRDSASTEYSGGPKALLGDKRDTTGTMWAIIVGLSSSRFRIAARFLSDMGMFLFRKGDWNTAKLALEGACRIDPENPYVHANHGFLLSYDHDEMNALTHLAKAFGLFEEQRNKEEAGAVEFHGSGRIYYQVGILAYKAQRRNIVATDDKNKQRLQEFAENARKQLANWQQGTDLPSDMSPSDIKEEFIHLFDNGNIDSCLECFRKSAECYLRIKDVTRTLPSLILYCDPLNPDIINRQNIDKHVLASRFLLWELSYGMGPEFVGNIVRLLNRVDQYLTRGRTVDDV